MAAGCNVSCPDRKTIKLATQVTIRIGPPPEGYRIMNESHWTVYRTRFLVRARQLTAPLAFTDALGRDHSGQPGDYLIESSSGIRHITPRAVFEDIYVPLGSSVGTPLPPRSSPQGRSADPLEHRSPGVRAPATA